MKTQEIEEAFSGRKILDGNNKSFDFEDLACSVVTFREIDQLNIIPSLMIHVLKNKNTNRSLNYAEMIIFRLMPQSAGWKNLIDFMDKNEITATLRWLKHIKDYSFVENCTDELRLAVELYESRC